MTQIKQTFDAGVCLITLERIAHRTTGHLAIIAYVNTISIKGVELMLPRLRQTFLDSIMAAAQSNDSALRNELNDWVIDKLDEANL
jgi:hypothetical protein